MAIGGGRKMMADWLFRTELQGKRMQAVRFGFYVIKTTILYSILRRRIRQGVFGRKSID
jgi:hypothetical protein